LLARAANLRQRIIREGVTKYNVGAGVWQRPANAARVILVPGQVESDASITFGAPVGACSVRRNMALLQAVRQANPDAYVVYKPHPDVLAGLRLQGENEDSALNWCDEVVTAVPMAVMLDCVDEVHVITSLAGFEALLRGKTVCCYGQPFYAGWGLTMDRAPLARRTRRLSLDALVAGALILYPTYVSRITRQFTTPERVLDELLQWREAQAKGRVPLWRKLWRLILQRLKW
jgi:capsular polysaccharide export protein